MRRLLRKLVSRRAETLTELLISVLVISLGLTMFATAVMTSRRMIEIGTEKVETYYNVRNTLEKEENSSNASLHIEENGKGSVNIGVPAGNTMGTYPIKVYGAGTGQESVYRYSR